MSTSEIDRLCINTIRTLAIDSIQKANSGHPGTPMGMAPVAYGLWQKQLNFDPADPLWPNRDRFILSAGHASMLLYAMLHLAGVKAVNSKYETKGELSVSLSDIKRFRQLDSKCPGHPEYRWTSGVETTTGPLGQGVATSVGMAIAAKRPNAPVHHRIVGAIEVRGEPSLGDRKADAHRDTLTERTGRGLDPLGQAVFRVSGRDAAPLAERLQVLQ